MATQIRANPECLVTTILMMDQLCQKMIVHLEGCFLLIKLEHANIHQKVMSFCYNSLRVHIQLPLSGLPLTYKVAQVNNVVVAPPLIVIVKVFDSHTNLFSHTHTYTHIYIKNYSNDLFYQLFFLNNYVNQIDTS